MGRKLKAFLRTSDPDGMMAAGQKIDAEFELSGNPITAGDVELSVYDYYRERRFQQKFPFTVNKDGKANIQLPFDSLKLGTGVFHCAGRTTT